MAIVQDSKKALLVLFNIAGASDRKLFWVRKSFENRMATLHTHLSKTNLKLEYIFFLCPNTKETMFKKTIKVSLIQKGNPILDIRVQKKRKDV